ncbi:MAG: CsbD family protein [Chloroflexota bacterium]|nr:MAG: CsbD family protein [Chloroflexota bacterium]
MLEDILSGKWKQIRGDIKEKWGELTDDEIDQIEGRREKLIGKLQEKYGYSKLEAEREISEFIESLEVGSDRYG